MPPAIADVFPVYRCVAEGWLSLDAMDDVSIDDIDEMLMASAAINAAQPKEE